MTFEEWWGSRKKGWKHSEDDGGEARWVALQAYRAGREARHAEIRRLNADPYADAVACFGSDEPSEVSAKMVTAMDALPLEGDDE